MTNLAALTIRPMQTGDIHRLIQIANQLPQAPHWPATAYQSALNLNLAPRRLALVAESIASGEILGFIVASLVAGEAELESVAVALDSQRHGLGAELLDNLLASLKSASIARINLEVRASNHPALALYARHGFTETGRRIAYYADPVEDAVLMHLDLG
jgi:ribosomal-protein-alanine N-acetyltransferase